jgi:hypothetical protein
LKKTEISADQQIRLLISEIQGHVGSQNLPHSCNSTVPSHLTRETGSNRITRATGMNIWTSEWAPVRSSASMILSAAMRLNIQITCFRRDKTTFQAAWRTV